MEAQAIQRDNIFRRIGFPFLLLFLFLVHARILDRLSFLHITILSLYLAVCCMVAAGCLFRMFRSRLGWIFAGLNICLLLSFFFSIWKGGSALILRSWFESWLVFAALAGLVIAYRDWRKTMRVLAWAVLALALAALVMGDRSDSRLILPGTRFDNPNALGQMLIIGLAFWWYVIIDPSISGPRRLLAVLASAPLLLAAAQTGSRSTMIGFAVVVLMLFLKVSLGNKIKIGLVSLVAVVLSAALLPQPLRDRYFVFFKEKEIVGLVQGMEASRSMAMQQSAVESSNARWEVFKTSVQASFEHPIVGVGPGMFPVAQARLAEERGEDATWLVTHNTFTEVSSENGLVAFILYVAAVLTCYGHLRKLSKTSRSLNTPFGREVANGTLCLNLALTSYVVGSFFASFAYEMYFTLLAGLIVGLHLTVEAELDRGKAVEALREVPAPHPARTRFRYAKT